MGVLMQDSLRRVIIQQTGTTLGNVVGTQAKLRIDPPSTGHSSSSAVGNIKQSTKKRWKVRLSTASPVRAHRATWLKQSHQPLHPLTRDHHSSL